jgi:hypothetical protein
LRPAIAKYGATLTIEEESKRIGASIGGAGRALVYLGLTTATPRVDSQRAFDLYGGTFNASAWQIHREDLSTQTAADRERHRNGTCDALRGPGSGRRRARETTSDAHCMFAHCAKRNEPTTEPPHAGVGHVAETRRWRESLLYRSTAAAAARARRSSGGRRHCRRGFAARRAV